MAFRGKQYNISEAINNLLESGSGSSDNSIESSSSEESSSEDDRIDQSDKGADEHLFIKKKR